MLPLALQAADLSKAADSASTYRSACQGLQNRLDAILLENSSLNHQHNKVLEVHGQETSSLEQQLQVARATSNQSDTDLQRALAELAAAKASISALKDSVAEGEQQLETSNQNLLTQTATYDKLCNEHAQIVATCSELSANLHEKQCIVQTKVDEAAELLAMLTAEKAAKVCLSMSGCPLTSSLLGASKKVLAS